MTPLPIKKISILLGILMATTACSSLRVSIPYAKVETPETLGGEWDFGYQVWATPTSVYEFTDSAASRPPNLARPRLSKSLVMAGQGFASILNNLDVGLTLSSAGTSLEIKYQLLGEPLNSSMIESNVASIFGSIGSGSLVASGNQSETFGSGGFPWNAKVTTNFYEIGASYGYRLRKDKLFYAGYSRNNHSFSGSIVQDKSDDGKSAGGTYDIPALNGVSQTLALGMEQGSDSRMRILVGISREQIGTFSTDNGFISLGVQDRFGDPNLKIQTITKDRWNGSDFGALGCSYLVGFGCGQSIQDRWKNRGRYFAIADATGLGVAVTSMVNGSLSVSGPAGPALLMYFVSRIWQIVDVIIDASSSQSERPAMVIKPEQNSE